MATYAARARDRVTVRAAAGDAAARRSWPFAAAGLVVLALLSVLLRTQRMDVGFWIDEALSVGIADRPLTEIPGVLRLDGSPPLYYLILHVWMRAAGTGEVATHWLSLLFATATIPVAWALVRPLFGAWPAWVAAAFVAGNPFLTQYAQETRMYSLVVLLGTVACGAFVGAFVLRRGRIWTLGFAASLAALLYTHNWALFFAVACGVAWVGLCWATRDRWLVREGAIGFGAAGLLFVPWLPTLLFQAAHTGAPWAQAPNVEQLLTAPARLLNDAPAAVLAVAGGMGAATLVRPWSDRGRALVCLAGMVLGTIGLAWVASQVAPAWANRYLAIAVPPLLLLAAVGVARAGVPGLVALAIVLGAWASEPGPTIKSNVRELGESIDLSLAPGDLVVSTQPEQLPAVAYYLETPGLRYATLTGAVSDVGITDWRDGPERLEAVSPARNLAPLLDNLGPDGRVVVVEPYITDLARWDAPWTRLVRLRSAEWIAAMGQDPRFRVVAVRPMKLLPYANPLRATLFARVPMR